MLINAGVAYVADGESVSAVPLFQNATPTKLSTGLTHARALASDDTYVYVADRGEPAGIARASGFLLRVPRTGGTVEKLAGPLKWPTVVAADKDRIYFMGDGSGDVWARPKAGGAASVFIPTPPGDWTCRSTAWLHVNERGLQYLRKSKGWDSVTHEIIDWGTLWSIQRSWMTDPVKQLADYLAKGSAAGGGSRN